MSKAWRSHFECAIGNVFNQDRLTYNKHVIESQIILIKETTELQQHIKLSCVVGFDIGCHGNIIIVSWIFFLSSTTIVQSQYNPTNTIFFIMLIAL